MSKNINLRFRAFFDEIANVWVAISDENAMTTEAASQDELKKS